MARKKHRTLVPERRKTMEMSPTTVSIHGLEYPGGDIRKRSLNDIQRACEVEEKEIEEAKASRIFRITC